MGVTTDSQYAAIGAATLAAFVIPGAWRIPVMMGLVVGNPEGMAQNAAEWEQVTREGHQVRASVSELDGGSAPDWDAPDRDTFGDAVIACCGDLDKFTSMTASTGQVMNISSHAYTAIAALSGVAGATLLWAAAGVIVARANPLTAAPAAVSANLLAASIERKMAWSSSKLRFMTLTSTKLLVAGAAAAFAGTTWAASSMQGKGATPVTFAQATLNLTGPAPSGQPPGGTPSAGNPPVGGKNPAGATLVAAPATGAPPAPL